MIQIVSGKLGSGKTLFTVMTMFDALCKGQTVVTNIKVFYDHLSLLAAKLKRVRLQEEQIIFIDPEKNTNWQDEIPLGTPDCFVECYFDEVHLFYNARDWATTHKNNRGLLSFLTQSRKARVNVTFIVQDSETLERQFRLQAEWELFIASSAHIPLGPLGTLPIKFFIVSKLDARNRVRVSKIYRKYDKRFFKCYDSFSFLDSHMEELAANTVRLPRIKLKKIGLLRWLLGSINIKLLINK